MLRATLPAKELQNDGLEERGAILLDQDKEGGSGRDACLG